MIRYPDESILAILEVRQDRVPEAVLGTGFVVAPRGVFVTARHVLAERPADSKNVVAVAIIEAHDNTCREFRPIHNVRLSSTADVAIAELQSLEGLRLLSLNRGEAPTNVDVLTIDHSSTYVTTDEQGKRVIFSHGTLTGNIVRHYVSNYPVTRGMRCFDTSFPALGGASGAPVIRLPSFGVVGMLVANVGRHLLPARILTAHESGSVIEEVRYYLPFGQALEADEVIAALEALGVPVEG